MIAKIKNVGPTRVVVIGKNGFVGNQLLKELLKQGINHVGIGRDEIDLISQESITFMRKLIRNGDTVVFSAGEVPSKDLHQYARNIEMIENFIKGINAKELNQLIYVSSDAVYGDSEIAITESLPLTGSTLHGLMHIERERLLAKSDAKNSLCIVRPTLIYGLRDPHNGYGPAKFFRSAIKDEPIRLFGNGEELRDFIHISDVGRLIRKVITNRVTGELNLATGKSVTFFELAETVIEYCKSKSEVIFLERVGPMPHNGYRPFDIKFLEVALGKSDLLDVSRGIKLMVAGE